jgi:UDP-MurNAc hydroxylase
MTMSTSKNISVKMIYAACVVIKTPDLTILCDPWFTDGIYDGSWFLYPTHDNPLSVIGDCDVVYISHIHPDHYDPTFLRQYFAEFGSKPFIIAERTPNYLASKLRQDFKNAELIMGKFSRGNTNANVYPHETGSINEIDSALEVELEYSNKCHRIINLNDCVYDKDFLNKIRNKKNYDICLAAYTAAGSYPQTYFSVDDPTLEIESEKKKKKMLDRYLDTTKIIGAQVNIPFAGQYVLGGRLTKLNRFRGVVDATEVLNLEPQSVVLEEYGGTIDTDHLIAIHGRCTAHSDLQLEARLNEIADRKMDYELDSYPEPEYEQIYDALTLSEINARKKSECTEDHFFVFVFDDELNLVVNVNQSGAGGVRKISCASEVGEPRSEIYIDRRYLFGLLTKQFHWNNAEVGSQYETRRIPNKFDRAVQGYLNFLAI